MVIASIDILDSKVVQLKQGKDIILEKDNAGELAKDFDLCGEIAVIDLNAAMGKELPGASNFVSLSHNIEMIKPLLQSYECRVGGGIRTAEQAIELVSLGAKKIIIGSSVFRPAAVHDAGAANAANGPKPYSVNFPLLEDFAEKIGRERLIVAVDSRNGEIVIDGWKTNTGLPLIETAKSLEKHTGGLLFTCVEREGTMTGINMEQVRELRKAFSGNICVAGGVSTLGEIEELSSMGCDVQLGMALYRGDISLPDAFISSLNWKKAENGLLPLIAQSSDGQILMTGYTDKIALSESFKRKKLCFHSRSRNKLWMKGENSGNTLDLIRIRMDCDADAILAIVDPAGPICHTGNWSCFFPSRKFTWEFLQNIINDRFKNPVKGSYTATLDDKLVREKIMEEAEEFCLAQTRDEKIWEAADLIYFATVLMSKEGITIEDVLSELQRRHLSKPLGKPAK